MKISDQLFSADVELPCKLFYESGTAVSGTVTSIDTGNLVLELQAAPKDLGLEDRVGLLGLVADLHGRPPQFGRDEREAAAELLRFARVARAVLPDERLLPSRAARRYR